MMANRLIFTALENTAVTQIKNNSQCEFPNADLSFFLSSLWGDVAINAEASSGPNVQPHIL